MLCLESDAMNCAAAHLDMFCQAGDFSFAGSMIDLSGFRKPIMATDIYVRLCLEISMGKNRYPMISMISMFVPLFISVFVMMLPAKFPLG